MSVSGLWAKSSQKCTTSGGQASLTSLFSAKDAKDAKVAEADKPAAAADAKDAKDAKDEKMEEKKTVPKFFVMVSVVFVFSPPTQH